jgi:hypothetical protein
MEEGDIMAELVSLSEYARRRGLNKSTISRQVRDGFIPTRDGKINPVEADRARAENLDPSRGGSCRSAGLLLGFGSASESQQRIQPAKAK